MNKNTIFYIFMGVILLVASLLTGSSLLQGNNDEIYKEGFMRGFYYNEVIHNEIESKCNNSTTGKEFYYINDKIYAGDENA